MKFYTYILKSIVSEVYYVGSTSDLEGRVELHNSKKARWTKRYQPWVLIHFEKFSTRAEAVKRERYIKSVKNIKKFLAKIPNAVG